MIAARSLSLMFVAMTLAACVVSTDETTDSENVDPAQAQPLGTSPSDAPEPTKSCTVKDDETGETINGEEKTEDGATWCCRTGGDGMCWNCEHYDCGPPVLGVKLPTFGGL